MKLSLLLLTAAFFLPLCACSTHPEQVPTIDVSKLPKLELAKLRPRAIGLPSSDLPDATFTDEHPGRRPRGPSWDISPPIPATIVIRARVQDPSEASKDGCLLPQVANVANDISPGLGAAFTNTESHPDPASGSGHP